MVYTLNDKFYPVHNYRMLPNIILGRHIDIYYIEAVCVKMILYSVYYITNYVLYICYMKAK